MVHGYSPTAARFNISEKTARNIWREWADLREPDLPENLPSLLGLHRVVIAGAERTQVTDIRRLELIDVLEDDQADTLAA